MSKRKLLYEFLTRLDNNILLSEAAADNWLIDQRRKRRTQVLACVQPTTPQQIAAILNFCNQQRIAVVPQGGNTGLVAATLPPAQLGAVLLSTRRLTAIRMLDLVGGLITVEAGLTLDAVRAAAQKVELNFPLAIGSRSRCTIGGNLATNAGGIEAVRYGSIRNLCLGLEFVLADGTIIDRTAPLFKDNSGYNLSQLVIGSEGTLAIITAASLRLMAANTNPFRAIIYCQHLDLAMGLLQKLRQLNYLSLNTFEAIYASFFPDLKLRALPDAVLPPQPANWLLLLEASLDRSSFQQLASIISEHCASFHNCSWHDLSDNRQTAKDLWQFREHLSDIQSNRGSPIKHDISLPLNRLPDFMTAAITKLRRLFPHAVAMPFGHCADGNIHFDIALPRVSQGKASSTTQLSEIAEQQRQIQDLIHDLTLSYGGSIAAEHGIGRDKQALLSKSRSEAEIALMQAVKTSFDPNHILNPGAVLPVLP